MITGITLALKENSQSVETNRTNVTISATITWNSGSYDYYGMPLTLKLDGEQVEYKTGIYFNRAKKTSGSEVFYTYTTDVEHNSNGDKTLACELIYHTNLMGGTRTVSASWPLTQIARASTIAATAADIGAVSMISVNRKNSAFTHTIAYAFVESSGYIQDADGSVGADPVKLTATSIGFPVPESFYAQIPSTTGGECTLTCRTYSGNTQIGEDKTCKFKVTANTEDCRPVVNGAVVDINASTIALTGDDSILVAGASTALCTMAVETRNGAEIESRMIGGSSVSENERTIDKIQLQEILFSATDSRGYTGTDTVVPQIIPYVRLTCNPVAMRVDPTGSDVLLTVKGKYYDGSFGDSGNPNAVSNTLRITCTAENDEGILSVDIPDDAFEFQDGSYTATVALTGFDYRNSYTVEVAAEDALTTLKNTAVVQKGIPVFDWGEHDFAFNVPVSFQGATLTDLVVEQGTTEGGWHYRKWSSRKIELWKRVSFTTTMNWINDDGPGNFIGCQSQDTVQDEHGFLLHDPVEIATVTGGSGCWLGSAASSVGSLTEEYRIFSYEQSGQVSVSINFYIFANDYED